MGNLQQEAIGARRGDELEPNRERTREAGRHGDTGLPVTVMREQTRIHSMYEAIS